MAKPDKIAGVFAKGAAKAGRQQDDESAFDVWGRTRDGLNANEAAFREDPGAVYQAAADGMRRQDDALALENWSHTDLNATVDAFLANAEGVGDAAFAFTQAEGALGKIGAGFGVLTALEQTVSVAFSAIPFPALPAVRIMDQAVGLPHGHAHPPNIVGPGPPIPLPSAGPVIPIPFVSGAAKVLVNNMPAGRCGDMGLGIWCGGYFPMYEIFLGSSSVWLEGARAARVGVDITKHCIFTTPRPMDLPIGPPIGMTMTSSPNVSIGGVPLPSLSGIAIGKAFGAAFKGLGKLASTSAGKAVRKAAGDLGRRGFRRLGNLAADVKCFFLEPVDAVTGEVFVEHLDFETPGLPDFSWTRTYRSGRARVGVCGRGWNTPADARLEIGADGSVCFHDGLDGGNYFDRLPGNSPQTDPFDGSVLSFFGTDLVLRRRSGHSVTFRLATSRREYLIFQRSDPFGNRTTFLRDDCDSLTAIQFSDGRELRFATEAGLVRRMSMFNPIVGEAHPVCQYRYDGDLLTGWIDASGREYTFGYENNVMVRHTDRNGLSFYYQYDQPGAQGQVVRAWGDDGLHDGRIRYCPAGGYTLISDPHGGRWEIHYNQAGMITLQVDPLGRATEYTYDNENRIAEVLKPGGRRTAYDYDENGNITKETRPDGAEVISTYNDRGNIIALTQADGSTWQFERDERGAITHVVSPRGGRWHYKVDGNGNIVRERDPCGEVTHFAFDQTGLIAERRTRTSVRSYARDWRGSVEAYTEDRRDVWQFSYDPCGQLISATNPKGGTTRNTYDAEGNLLSHTNEAGHTTRFEYFGIGEVSRRINPDGSEVRYEYDIEERLTCVVNELGQRMRLMRDAAGRVEREIDYWGSVRRMHYNDDDTVRQLDLPTGRSVFMQYDPAGRLTRRQGSTGEKETFEYDVLGRLTAAENEAIRIERTYDEDGNLTLDKQGERGCAMEYDLVGRLISQTSLDGGTTGFEYGSESEISRITRDGENIISFEAEREKRLRRTRFGKNVVHETRFDVLGMMEEERVAVGEDVKVHRAFAYDDLQQPTEIAEIVNGERHRYHWDYDPMQRISAFRHNEDAPIRYTDRDASGSRLSQLDRQVGQNGYRRAMNSDVKCAYDADGNMIFRQTADRRLKLKWNAFGRLTKAENGGQSTLYFYDPLGRRVIKKHEKKFETFVWADNKIINIDNQLNQNMYVYTPNSFSPIVNCHDYLSMNLNDSAGFGREAIDINGNIISMSTYAAECTHRETEEIIFGYAGQIIDRETNLSYNRYRYFDNELSNFISQDPLRLFAGPNLYRYAPNTRVWIDPLGLACTFKNQLPELLEAELEAARRVGAKPIRFGEAGTEEILNSGTIKFVVDDGGQLIISPHTVHGQEISHAVLSGGRPVRTAGQADIAAANGQYTGIGISPHSGHYKPSQESLGVAENAFGNHGVFF